MLSENLGRVLEYIGKTRQKTQVMVAEAVGVCRGHLCDLYKGKKQISLKLLEKFSKFYGIPPKQLIALAEIEDWQLLKSRLQREGLSRINFVLWTFEQ